MNKKKNVTIYDVAKASGFSPATVSRVLGNSDYPVKPEVREKVQKAAKELKYTPNLLGKYLKTNNTRDIGVVVPNITNPYYTSLLQGIHDMVMERGYDMILCNSYRDPKTERSNIDLLMQKRVKGLLVVSIDQNTRLLRQVAQQGQPMVVMEQEKDVECDRVGFDFFRGGYLGTEYLLQHGHRDIVFVGARLDRYSRREVHRGFQTCMEERGISCSDERAIIVEQPEQDSHHFFEVQLGAYAVQQILQRPQMPTACFCMNDMIAMGVIRAFKQRGVHVPRDISVMGFDNIDFCDVFMPGLTTVDQSGYELGRTSAKMVIDRIEGLSDSMMSVKLEPKLCIRESVRDV